MKSRAEIHTHYAYEEFFHRIKIIILRRLRLYYYKLSNILFEYSTININGVGINTDNQVISKNMREKLQMGTYERPETILIKNYLNSNIPAIDLGAGVGYSTCLIDNILRESETVIAVEANDELIPVISQTRKLNNSTFEIINSVYGTDDDIEFHISEDFWSSSTFSRDKDSSKKTNPKITSIDKLLELTELTTPFQLVVDIEGAEQDLILNEIEVLKESCQLLIIEFHSFGNLEPNQYKRVLTDNGFRYLDSIKNTYVYINTVFEGSNTETR